MCGTSEYSVTELREHHVVCGATGDFRKILDWFWTAVANMSEEEKARLLQFTTGCSQLPPGWFVGTHKSSFIASTVKYSGTVVLQIYA